MKIIRLMVTLLGSLIFGNSMAAEIYLECDGKEYSVSLNDSQEAKEFLKQLPQELKFEDYGAFERIAYLTKKLAPAGPANGFTPLTGDLTYYAPWGNLAVFIKDFRPSTGLYSLGTLSPEALKAIKESGSRKIRFYSKD